MAVVAIMTNLNRPAIRLAQQKTGGLNLATQAAGRVFRPNIYFAEAKGRAAGSLPYNYFTASVQPTQGALHDGAGQQTVTGTCLHTTRGQQRVTVYGTCFSMHRGTWMVFV